MTQPHQRRSINCRPRSTLFPITLRCLCYCKMQIIRTENREREGREGREEKGTPEPILFLEGVITLARPGAKRKKKVCLQSDYKGEILKVYDGATSFLIVTDLFFLSFFFLFRSRFCWFVCWPVCLRFFFLFWLTRNLGSILWVRLYAVTERKHKNVSRVFWNVYFVWRWAAVCRIRSQSA